MKTRSLLLYAVLSLFALVTFAQDTIKIKEIINDVQVKFLPDKRHGIFSIEFKMDQNGLIVSGETDNKEAAEALVSELNKNGIGKIQNGIIVLPEEALKDNTGGIIKVSVANMRKRPDHDEEMTSQAVIGTQIKLLKKRAGFYLIQTPDKYIGWIESGSIAVGNKAFIDDWNKSKKVVYTEIFGLVYSKPDEKSDPVMDIVVGGVIQFESIKGGWIKVKTLKDETGYIKVKSAMEEKEWIKTRKATPETIVKTGRGFLGFPYLWGGYSSKGLDCSGFVKTTYWLNGILLPRDANQQALIGEEVKPGKDMENCKMGDLLLFGKPGKDGKPRITHVGIYIKDREFIHCAACVQLSSFKKDSKSYDPWHCENLAKVMRILK